MLSFQRFFSIVALLASLVLLSSARPTHHGTSIRARAPAGDLVTRFQSFHAEMVTCNKDLNKTATDGENPQDKVKKIVASFDAMTTYLGQTQVKLTPNQETQCADIVADVLKMVNEASYQVASKAKFTKWYSHWTEEDVAIQGFLVKFVGVSFGALKMALTKAGSASCSHFHDLNMRLTVNMFRGVGVGY